MNYQKISYLTDCMYDEQNHVSCRGFNSVTRKLADQILGFFGIEYDFITEIPVIEYVYTVIRYCKNDGHSDKSYELTLHRENNCMLYCITNDGEYDRNGLLYEYFVRRSIETGAIEQEQEQEQEKNLLTFRYWVEVKKGYYPTMGTEPETDICFYVKAKNRVTADRMVRAMLEGNTNIIDVDGICIE